MFNIFVLKYYINAHFISNAILAAIFLVLRTCRPFCTAIFPVGNQEFPVCKLSWGEGNIFFFLLCTLIVKNRRDTSIKKYIGNIFLFSKVANTVLFFQTDPRLMLLYLVACLFVLVLFPEPVYTGPINVTYFNNNTLEEELEENPHTTWLVEFYANWSSECQGLSKPFAELSYHYSHANFKFGKVDAGKYPEIARKFGVDISPLVKQLPTLILFQKGKEAMRKPGMNSRGAVVKYSFTQEAIFKDFDIKNLFESTKSKATKKADKKQLREEQEEAKKTR